VQIPKKKNKYLIRIVELENMVKVLENRLAHLEQQMVSLI